MDDVPFPLFECVGEPLRALSCVISFLPQGFVYAPYSENIAERNFHP